MELKARAKKEDRIAALVPFYRQGYVFHNKNNCFALENQLLAFPKSRLWDIMDALAYVVEVLELDQNYFDPVATNDDDIESEYEELEYDDPVEYMRYV
jgi:hypothetical protein